MAVAALVAAKVRRGNLLVLLPLLCMHVAACFADPGAQYCRLACLRIAARRAPGIHSRRFACSSVWLVCCSETAGKGARTGKQGSGDAAERAKGAAKEHCRTVRRSVLCTVGCTMWQRQWQQYHLLSCPQAYLHCGDRHLFDKATK